MRQGPIRAVGSDVAVDLLVVPNAARSGVIGLHGDRVKVRVAGPPTRNKANAAVVGLLKEATGARRVEIIRGGTGRHKTVVLSGVSVDRVAEVLTSTV